MGLFKHVIPTKMFPRPRNPDSVYLLIPIPNIHLTEVPDALIFGEQVAADSGDDEIMGSVLSKNQKIVSAFKKIHLTFLT